MKIGKSLSCIGRGIASAALAVLAGCSPQQQIPEATLISTKGQVITSEVEKGTDQNIEELQTEKQLPRREFRLYAANPKDGFEANTAAWNTTNQLIGRASDYVGIVKGLDNDFSGRLGQTVLMSWLALGTTYVSHEVAHNYLGRWKGVDNLEFTFDQFTVFGFPAVVSNSYRGPKTWDEYIFQSVSGLNQNTYNAQELFSKNQTTIRFDEAISFLENTFILASYATSPDGDQRAITGASFGDIAGYVEWLSRKGIQISSDDVLKEARIANLLSAPLLIDNAITIGKYIKTGEREKEPFYLKLGSIETTFPLVSYYLTTEGGYYNITCIANPRTPSPIELNLGTGTDFLGSSQTDTLRLGGKYHHLKTPYLSFSPYAFFNTDRNLKPKGFSVGTEVSVPIGKRKSIFLKIEYNKGDILENTIKGEEEGLNLSGGLEVLF